VNTIMNLSVTYKVRNLLSVLKWTHRSKSMKNNSSPVVALCKLCDHNRSLHLEYNAYNIFK
jgi:hypothetical protein